MQNPLIVALDSDDRSQLADWAESLAPHVGHLKVGLQAWATFGSSVVEDAIRRAPVFLDLKLHDIPNTVAGAAAAVGRLGIAMLTVHASGGPAMVQAAVKAAPDVAILGVTVLTSIDAETLDAVGQRPLGEQVVRLAQLAIDAGAAGVVCAPSDIARVRAAIGPAPLVVVPGIRPAGSSHDDQARVATPAEALAAGASHLVVGRPITTAPDPVAAAADLQGQMAESFGTTPR